MTTGGLEVNVKKIILSLKGVFIERRWTANKIRAQWKDPSQRLSVSGLHKNVLWKLCSWCRSQLRMTDDNQQVTARDDGLIKKCTIKKGAGPDGWRSFAPVGRLLFGQ